MSRKEKLATIPLTRGNGFKLKESRFRLGIRNKIITVRELCKLLRKVVDTTFLEVFKTWWSNVV